MDILLPLFLSEGGEFQSDRGKHKANTPPYNLYEASAPPRPF